MLPQESESTTKIKEKFLKLLGSKDVKGNVSYCCELVGVSRVHMYSLRKRDPEFRIAWEEAQEQGDKMFADLAENKLATLVSQGNLGAIIFTLKNRAPKRWKGDKFLMAQGDVNINSTNINNTISVGNSQIGAWANRLIELHGREKAIEIGHQIADLLGISIPGGDGLSQEG